MNWLDTIWRPLADWIEALTAAGVPCGPVNGVEAALADPQTAARRLVVETASEAFGSAKWIASPVRVGSSPPEHRAAPSLGGDTERVLSELLGYDRNRIEALSNAGAVNVSNAMT